MPQDPTAAFPGWMNRPNGLSATQYETLPEDTCCRIEIIDGAAAVNVGPSRLPHVPLQPGTGKIVGQNSPYKGSKDPR